MNHRRIGELERRHRAVAPHESTARLSRAEQLSALSRLYWAVGLGSPEACSALAETRLTEYERIAAKVG